MQILVQSKERPVWCVLPWYSLSQDAQWERSPLGIILVTKTPTRWRFRVQIVGLGGQQVNV